MNSVRLDSGPCMLCEHDTTETWRDADGEGWYRHEDCPPERRLPRVLPPRFRLTVYTSPARTGFMWNRYGTRTIGADIPLPGRRRLSVVWRRR